MNLDIKIEYLSDVNWPLLRAGIPLIREFRILSLDNRPKDTKLEISLPYLKTTAITISSKYIEDGIDISGLIHPLLTHNWDWLGTWKLGDLSTSATLQLKLDHKVVNCNIHIQPPTYWQRVLGAGRRPAGRLAIKRSEIHLEETGTQAHFEDGYVDWNSIEMPYPPLEAALAALIDPNDPYVRSDGPKGSLGQAVFEIMLVLSGKAARTARPSARCKVWMQVLDRC